jgi:ABC-type antimicrobial peptide transport system permease subunit
MAAAGTFGVVQHAVVRRSREFGIRLALGCRREGIAWLVLRTSLRDTLLGALAGWALAALLARVVRAALPGIAAEDSLSFALAPAVLVLTGVAACALPVWRASTTDATRCLREN